MIQKEKIEKAKKFLINEKFDNTTSYFNFDIVSKLLANYRSFAEAELQSIAAEYGVWIETENKYTFRYRENLWKSFHKADKPLTAKEHFELFLKERNEQ